MNTIASTVNSLVVARYVVHLPALQMHLPLGPTILQPDSNVRLLEYQPRGRLYQGGRGGGRIGIGGRLYKRLELDQCYYCFR